jgi:16S rRNA (cytidine1402-2'-O)-methyltransferase
LAKTVKYQFLGIQLHEENIRGTVKEVAAHFDKIAPRGEIVVVVGGKIITKEPKKK